MLLHVMSYWPKIIMSEFWSFAFMQAVNQHNFFPQHGQSKSPFTLFTNEDCPLIAGNFRVFGCPVYVLDSDLQSQNHTSGGKWSNQCYQGVYIGHSKHHASNVVLVYNPITKLVLPQYHIVFDEDFTLIKHKPGSQEHNNMIDQLFTGLISDIEWTHSNDFMEAPDTIHHYFNGTWDFLHMEELAHQQCEHEPHNPNSHKHSHDALETSSTTPSDHEGAVSTPQSNDRSTEDGQSNVPNSLLPLDHKGAYLPNHSPTTDTVLADKNVTAELDPQQPASPDDSPPHHVMATTEDEEHSSPNHARLVNIVSQLSMAPPSKRKCLSKENSSLSQDEQALFNQLKSLIAEFQTAQTNTAEPLSEQSDSEIDFSALHDIINQQNRMHDGLSFEGIFNLRDPHAFAAGSQTNLDILTQSQMFKAADHKNFIESQVPEIDGLVEAGVFEYLQMNELPQDTRLLNAIWSYHRKCQPDHSLLKHKSCICVDGSKQQHGIDYWDTYSPVVHWSTI